MNMHGKTLTIHMANDDHATPAHIEIADPIQIGDTVGETDRIMTTDARWLADALYNSLPGGTFDRLLAELFRRKTSHFVVSFGSFEQQKPGT